MNLPISFNSKNNKEYIECPRSKETTDVDTCKKCYFLRVCLATVVKCTWNPEKEELLKKKHNYLPESYAI